MLVLIHYHMPKVSVGGVVGKLVLRRLVLEDGAVRQDDVLNIIRQRALHYSLALLGRLSCSQRKELGHWLGWSSLVRLTESMRNVPGFESWKHHLNSLAVAFRLQVLLNFV